MTFSMHVWRDLSGPFALDREAQLDSIPHRDEEVKGGGLEKKRLGEMAVVVVGGERPVSAAFLPQPGHWVGSTFRSGADWAAADGTGCQSFDLRWYSSSNLRLMSSMESCSRSQKPARSWAVGFGWLVFTFWTKEREKNEWIAYEWWGKMTHRGLWWTNFHDGF